MLQAPLNYTAVNPEHLELLQSPGWNEWRAARPAIRSSRATAGVRGVPGSRRCSLAEPVTFPGMNEIAVRGPERIRRALLGGYPLLYVVSWEEGRVERAIASLAQKFYEKPVPFSVWSCVNGIVTGTERVPDTAD